MKGRRRVGWLAGSWLIQISTYVCVDLPLRVSNIAPRALVKLYLHSYKPFWDFYLPVTIAARMFGFGKNKSEKPRESSRGVAWEIP